jgi:hypothetical protein
MHEQKIKKCDKAVVVERTTRILIVGDSHTKGMATEMQHNLERNYVAQGIVKSGTDLEVIIHSNTKESMNLTKDDFLTLHFCRPFKFLLNSYARGYLNI